jgi:murein DD-endopeptidase MepM/ murein hydrolase activator NlpD
VSAVPSVILAAALAAALPARAALFDFPTANRALVDGHPEDFYMYVERDFEGVRTQAWEAGQFGFVRGPQRTPSGVVCAKLHEGIDIRPLDRDPAGNPLDAVVAAADGRVAHVSDAAGGSNYGKYVVVEHLVEGAPIYTLSAHLASVAVAEGQEVRQGETLGRMGFTGAGIDRTRAHVHFEIGILMNRNFEAWHAANFPGNPNRHGLFNGLNICGTDPAAILKASAADPGFRLLDHLASLEPVFQLTVPNSPGLTILGDAPWLVKAGEIANPPAWKISFTGTGFPIRATAAPSAPAAPELSWVADSPFAYSLITRGLIAGPPGNPHLTAAGQRFAALLTAPAADPQAGSPEKKSGVH